MGMGVKKVFSKSSLKITNRKRWFALIAIICIALISAGIVTFVMSRSNDPVVQPKVGTESQAANSEIQRMLDNPVTASGSKEEQVAYFDELASLYAINKDYRQAVAAADRRMSISTSDMQYSDYIEIAYYYHELKNSQSALRFLDLAEESLIKVDRPNIGYYYQDWVTNINELREEYK